MAKLSFLDLTGLTIVKDNILGIISSHTSNNDIHISLEDRDKLNNIHTHDNKSILDATTASYTTEDKALVDTITNYLPLLGGTLLGTLYLGADKSYHITTLGLATLSGLRLDNGGAILIKDSNGDLRTLASLGTSNNFSFATADVENTIVFGKRTTTTDTKIHGKVITLGDATSSNTNKTTSIVLNGDTTINGTATITNNIDIAVEAASLRHYGIKNSLRETRLALNATGYFGFYDVTNAKWLYYSDSSGNHIFKTSVCIESLKKDDDTHVVVADSTGNLNVSTVTSTALYYIRNLSGDLQEQLDNRLTLSGGGTVNAPVSTQTLTPTSNSTSGTTGHMLGTSSYKWRYLYAFSSSIQTSDRRYKTNIEYISDNDVLSNVFDALQPCSFYMVGGDRKHLGLIAQDALKAMQDNGLTIDDLSFICKDHEYRLIDDSKSDTEDNREYMYDENGEPLYIYGLKYNELHALEINETQKLKKKVIDLNLALSEALARIDELERKI